MKGRNCSTKRCICKKTPGEYNHGGKTKVCTVWEGRNRVPVNRVLLSQYVCEGHADSHILALRPGEKQSFGECFFFERFGATDT